MSRFFFFVCVEEGRRGDEEDGIYDDDDSFGVSSETFKDGIKFLMIVNRMMTSGSVFVFWFARMAVG